MRRTNALRSGNYDLVELLGTDYDEVDGIPGITPWSIQADMLSNFLRLFSGLKGNAVNGRLLGGGNITINGAGESATISPFLLITKGNQVVWAQNPLTINLTGGQDSYELWAKFILSKVPDDAEYGKVASMVGSYLNPDIQMVADELAAGNPNVSAGQIISIGEPTEDSGLIGTVTINPEQGVELNPDRGFPVTDQNGYQLISKLLTEDLQTNIFEANNVLINDNLNLPTGSSTDLAGVVTISEVINFDAGSQVKLSGSNAVTGTFSFNEDGGASRSLVIENGLIKQTT